jgi:D-beta-D-heptose 7-phosphate kinase/D-beta-D-heptose 1-phosphate adenosyltransferase
MKWKLSENKPWVKMIGLSNECEKLIEINVFSCYGWCVPGKLKGLEELESIVSRGRASGKKIVFTNGCFDILHSGHVHLLREAKALGDVLIVAMNSDSSVRQLKGASRPVVGEEGRTDLIAALEMVDYVILFDDLDPYRLIDTLRPDVLVKGGDYSRGQVIGGDIVERSGGKVALIPLLQGFSTTDIIERARS